MRRSVVASLALLLPLAACRFGFDPLPGPGPGAMPGDASSDASPPLPVLPCGAPPQFSAPTPMGSGSGSGNNLTLRAVATAASDTAYYLLAVDSAGDVHSVSLPFDGDQLTSRPVDAPVYPGATGTGAAVNTGDGVLAAIAYGRPDPIGTALVPLDAQLMPRGAAHMTSAWFSQDAAIARAPDGTLAFLGVQSDGSAKAKRVMATGVDVDGGRQVVDPSERVSVATISAAGAGFLVTWAATPPSPNQVRAEILDSHLAVKVPPTTINPGAMFDGDNPRAGYAASADRYLFAWSFKTSSSNELWVSLRDSQLTELHAVRLSTHGVLPRVAAGKDDFLVAWKDTNTTSGIAAARVRFDGSVVPLVVSGHGGAAISWDLTTRAGQPVLVWVETGLTTALWFDPLCN